MYREQNGLFLVSINIARFIYLLAVTSDVVWQQQILIFNTNVYTYMWKKSKIYSVCIVKNVMFGVLIFLTSGTILFDIAHRIFELKQWRAILIYVTIV